jgi:hypothetical protein
MENSSRQRKNIKGGSNLKIYATRQSYRESRDKASGEKPAKTGIR